MFCAAGWKFLAALTLQKIPFGWWPGEKILYEAEKALGKGADVGENCVLLFVQQGEPSTSAGAARGWLCNAQGACSAGTAQGALTQARVGKEAQLGR